MRTYLMTGPLLAHMSSLVLSMNHFQLSCQLAAAMSNIFRYLPFLHIAMGRSDPEVHISSYCKIFYGLFTHNSHQGAVSGLLEYKIFVLLLDVQKIINSVTSRPKKCWWTSRYHCGQPRWSHRLCVMPERKKSNKYNQYCNFIIKSPSNSLLRPF